MHQIKLIVLLKNLNKEEFSRLGKFLNSPFYNYSNPPILLYEGLKKFFPTFDSPKLTKENIWSKVYPKEAFHPSKFWQLTSKLTQLVEQFLITIELEKKPTQKQQLLIHALSTKSKKLLLKELQKEEERVNDKKDIKDKFLFHLSINNFHGIFNTTEAIHYEEKYLNALEVFYLIEKLKSAINLKSVEKHRNLTYTFHLIPEITQLIEENDFNNPHLKILIHLFQLVNEEYNEIFFEIKKMFFQTIDTFDRENKKFVFHHLINYSIVESNKGEDSFRRENFELYKLGITHDIIVESSIISYGIFTTIVSLGASFKEFEWTEKFFKDHSKFLPQSLKDHALAISKGYLFFYQKEYSKAIDLLLNYPFDKTLDSIRSKGLIIRCYFELFLKDSSYYDLFTSFSISFEKYLSRDDIGSGNRIQLYLNFVKALRTLGRLIRENKYHGKFKKIYSKRISNEKIILKPWLINKIESIK